MTEMRPAIIKLHEKGVPKREIGRLLDVPEATVRVHIKRYEETGSHHNKPKGNTARNRINIQRAKGMIKRNPTSKANSSRKLAKPHPSVESLKRALKKAWNEIPTEMLEKIV